MGAYGNLALRNGPLCSQHLLIRQVLAPPTFQKHPSDSFLIRGHSFRFSLSGVTCCGMTSHLISIMKGSDSTKTESR